MRKLFIFIGFAGLAAATSCTDHEVIPPPVPLVDLNCECSAEIDDSINTVTYPSSVQLIERSSISKPPTTSSSSTLVI